jgi:hypothetical protein
MVMLYTVKGVRLLKVIILSATAVVAHASAGFAAEMDLLFKNCFIEVTCSLMM